MGYVLRCRGVQQGEVAWKLPRMIADTQRENVFIAQHLEVERCNVARVAGRDLNLVRSQIVNNPLEFETVGILPIDVDPNVHRPEQRVLVRFSKGNPLRFCGVVRASDGSVSVVPQGALAIDRPEDWDNLLRFAAANSSSAGKVQPGFLPDRAAPEEGAEGEASLAFALLLDAVEREVPRSGWYLGLPSIVYDWAAGTLQDVISNRRLTGWTTVQHLALVERILAGLNTLHQAGMLHGDLRTANVMYINDPDDPENYVVIDYAALSGRSGVVGQQQVDGDKTIMGPIANSRLSIFFAPERRQAFDHEDGDTAIIAREPGDKDALLVAIGWKSRLYGAMGADARSPSPAELDAIAEQFAEALGNATAELERESERGHARLRAGDRIRLREYVFDVLEIAPKPIEGFTVMRCKASVSKVCNERLVVSLLDFWGEFKQTAGKSRVLLMSLPKVTEIYQWSHATDLFSVGVLALYSVYAQAPEQPGRTDKEFEALLGTLANPLYFNCMWRSLEEVRRNLERIVEENPGIAAKELVTIPSGMPAAEGAKEAVTIYKACLTFVQHITQTAPYARQLLVEGFKGNIAEFILFIHFVFSCLHRRSDVFEQAHELGGESERRFPFAVDRTSRDPHASAQALSRARNLRRLFTMSVLRDMKAKIADLPAYLPISQAELILEMQRLELELFRAKDNLHSQHVELDRVGVELVRVRAEHERLVREYRELVRKIDDGGTLGAALRAIAAKFRTFGARTAGMLVKWWTARRNAARRDAELSEADEPHAAIPGERIEGSGSSLVEPCTRPARGQSRR
ncbi:hypothetical protein [Nannocystis sp. SCPEA4]|uniref:hypothetical protein n=1 Tax=Nannocystis sp. SCPEA4 TaxID=2996787 RepID=UPI00226E6F58|nr:hypothetical protein [Nannocystis sp. SCPEA4]MCY1059120.1 hypothetical protein [Nannocystis sp. SCPEA4]